jgi:hypothetical protein
MTKSAGTASRSVLISLLAFGMASGAAWAGDLSRYRDFQFGTDLAAVAKQTGASPSQIKVIDSRPALVQEIAWRPRPLGTTSHVDSVQEVVFTFFNGELFRIAVNYDRYETEGMTAGDMIDAISVGYGPAEAPAAAVAARPGSSGDSEGILADWQDSQYRFDLIRSSYGHAFSMVGVVKKLEAPAQAAALEAKRLDDQEAPQRDAARAATEAQEAQAKLDKARLLNKPKFRP